MIINEKKRTRHRVDVPVPADHRVKIKESKKIDRYLDLARELKTMEHEGDGDTKSIWCTSNSTKVLKKQWRNWKLEEGIYLSIHIYLIPPLGQDMTQGQFLSGV